MSKFIKYITIWGLVFVLVANLIGAGSLWVLRKSSFYKPTFLENAVKETAFDYIVLGASTGLTTLNTKIIDSLSGNKGVNLAIDDTGLANHYLMLQHFLALGKETKYCVMVPVWDALDSEINVQSDNDYRFLMYINNDYVYNYYQTLPAKDGLGVLKNSKWMPFLGVSYYNAELFFPSLVSLIHPQKRNRFDKGGNYTYTHVNAPTGVIKKQDKRLGFKNVYLKKIEDLCSKNNIKLIYYLSPNRKQRAIYKASQRVIINHSDIFKNNLYFYDDIHVNKQGNKIASALFAEEFVKLIKE